MPKEKDDYRGYLCGGCDQPVDTKDRKCPHCGIRFNLLTGFKVYHHPTIILCTKWFYQLGCLALLILFFLVAVLID